MFVTKTSEKRRWIRLSCCPWQIWLPCHQVMNIMGRHMGAVMSQLTGSFTLFRLITKKHKRYSLLDWYYIFNPCWWPRADRFYGICRHDGDQDRVLYLYGTRIWRDNCRISSGVLQEQSECWYANTCQHHSSTTFISYQLTPRSWTFVKKHNINVSSHCISSLRAGDSLTNAYDVIIQRYRESHPT